VKGTRTILALATTVVVGAPLAAADDDETVGVLTRDADLRSRPHADAPPWPDRRLAAGEEVVVLGRRGAFYRVATHAFVDGHYIEDGAVTSHSLNVRSAPRIADDTAVAWLQRGDPIVGLDRRGNWVQIAFEAWVPAEAVLRKAGRAHLQEDAPLDGEQTDEGLPLDLEPGATAPRPVDLERIEPRPIELAPIDLAPIDLAPIDLEPVDLEPVDLEPVDLEPVDPEPVGDAGPEQPATDPTLEAHPFAGTYALDGGARLEVAFGPEGYDVVRTPAEGPALTGFGDLDGDTLKVRFGVDRGLAAALSTVHAAPPEAAPVAEYEVAGGGRRIEGELWPEGREGDREKERGWRESVVAPVTGTFALEPGYLLGKKPIRLVVSDNPNGAGVRVVRETLRDGEWTERLEGFGRVEGRRITVQLHDAEWTPLTRARYEVREDGRIRGQLESNSWRESGWREGSIPPLAGRYRLEPSWYLLGYRPAVVLDVVADGDGYRVTRAVHDRREGRSSRRAGRAEATDDRELRVTFADGSEATYAVDEEGEVDGRFGGKAEDGWRVLD